MKIILIPFEVESYAMANVYKKLVNEGHDVYMVNADIWHFIDYDARWIRPYYKEYGVTNYYSLENEYRKLQQIKEYKVDWDFLDDFEKKYCREKNLHQLMMTDHIFNHKFRRPYYHDIVSSEQRYYWMERQIRWILDLIREIKPDVVFTLERNYFIKNLFWQICKTESIRFLTLVVGKIENRFYISEHYGYGSTEKFALDLLKNKDENVADQYIREYRDSQNFSVYNFSITEALVRNGLLAPSQVFKEFYANMKGEVRHLFKNKPLKRFSHPRYMDYLERKAWIYHSRRFLNKFRYVLRREKDFTTVLPKDNFVYFPLHLLPESSTLTLSNEYYEEDIIRFVASKLPAKYKLVVKDNPMMVGDRPYNYYKELKKIPNVEFIDPLYSSKEIVKKCSAIVGISGIALLEAKMCNKITYAFGFPEFIDIIDFRGHADIDRFIDSLKAAAEPTRKEYLLGYISYVKKHGVVLDWVKMLYSRHSDEFADSVNKVNSLLLGKLNE